MMMDNQKQRDPSRLGWRWTLVAACCLASLHALHPGRSRAAPQPKEDFTARLPVFEQARLANGLTVYSYQDDTLPVTVVAMAVRVGSAAEPADKGGLGQLAFSFLTEQTEVSEEETKGPDVADLGTRLVVRRDADGAVLRLSVLAAQAESAVAALARIVKPRPIAERDLALLKARYRSAQLVSLGWPRIRADEQLRRVIYGANHPYGHTPSGTQESLRGITAEDIAAFYRCTLFPKNLALVVTGRAAPGDVLQWAERHLGGWQAAPQSCEAPVPLPSAGKRTAVFVIPRPRLAQSQIFIGRALFPVGHKDEVALKMASSFLGAALNEKLRTDLGISCSTEVVQHIHGGHFILEAAVPAEQTGAAVSDMLGELVALPRNRFLQFLTPNARVHLAWGIVYPYSSLASSANRVSRLFFQGQPLAADPASIGRLGQVGPDDVSDAAYHYFTPDSMQIVVVGDPTLLGKQLGERKLGTLQWVTADGSRP